MSYLSDMIVIHDCGDCLKLLRNGGIPRNYNSTESDAGGYYPAQVRCEQCGISVYGDRTPESAINAWNLKWARLKEAEDSE